MSARQFRHFCPFIDAVIDQTCVEILDCRCFETSEFFAAQDAVALYLDCLRTPGEQ